MRKASISRLPTVNSGLSEVCGSCRIIPTSRPRMRHIWLSLLVGRSSPTIPGVSPARRSNLTPSAAFIAPALVSMRVVRFWTCRIGSGLTSDLPRT